MNRLTRRAVALAAASFAGGATILAAVGQVSSGSYELWWRTTTGGAQSTGGNYQVRAAIGQPLAGRSIGGSYTVTSGFHTGGGQDKYLRYLPQLAKDGTD